MIILNACSSVMISLNDSTQLPFFSVFPDPPKDFEMHLVDGVITDDQTAAFLRSVPLEWLRQDKQVLGIRIDASEDTCRDFLKSRVVHTEILLDHEESAL